METQNKSTAKDFFLNLGAIVALGFFIGNLISLLFTVISKAYPTTTGYGYYGSSSISFPVATLIIVFPLYVLLMWLLERDYSVFPDLKKGFVRRWLTFVTLFISGGVLIGDLVTVLYYFIDGQEMTTGFVMKVLSILVISLGIFFYYIYDLLGKLNSLSRKIWVGVSSLVIILSIIWGFSVLGSPQTQRLIKYDDQKVNDLSNISSQVQAHYGNNEKLPQDLDEMLKLNTYYLPSITDAQSGKPYVYKKTGDKTYELCAEFNKPSRNEYAPYSSDPYPNNMTNWSHPAGEYCFKQTANPNSYYKGAIPAY